MATPPDEGWPDHITRLTSVSEKDLDHERRLAELNALVAPIQDELERELVAPALPTVLVLGPPRGGTTLLSQLLATTGLFGVTSNLVARFWRAPALGMTMARALGIGDGSTTSNLRSNRGDTTGWDEPSEFGYFWSRYFDLGQDTHALSAEDRKRFDKDGLRRALAAMEHAAGRPLMVKNNTWFTLNADLMANVLPRSILVVCDRDPFFVAQSLWLQRLDLHGDPEKWWSVRPRDYEEIVKLPALEQVAAQAASIQTGMDAALAAIQDTAVFRADYARVSADPRGVVADISSGAGFSTSTLGEVIGRLPEKLQSTDVVRLEASVASDLKGHVDRHLARCRERGR